MRLGAYELVEQIGQGATGVVWRARGPDGHDVAVKLLAKSSTEKLARFEREARLHATLGREEGFVPLVGVVRSERGLALVMPFMGGGSLREKLARGPLSISACIELARRLAAAVARAHERGIVHRDLKPENVLFSDAGEAFVADLGVAKHFTTDSQDASQTSALSRTSELRGTAGYMPPEQMRDAKNVGPAADVFAIGALVYECLAGRPAFPGRSVIDVVGTVESGVFAPLSRVRPDAPRWLARVVERALGRTPEERYPDAGAMARALHPKEGAGRGARALAVAGAVLVLGGTVAFALTRGGPAPPGPEPPRPPAPPPVVRPPGPPPKPVVADPDVSHLWLDPQLVDAREAGTIEAALANANGVRLVRRLAGASTRWGGSRVLALMPDGSVGVGRDDGCVTFFRLAERQNMTPFTGDSAVVALAGVPAGLWVGRESGRLELFGPGSPEPVRLELDGPPLGLAANASGSRLLAIVGDALEVWDTGTNRRTARHGVPAGAHSVSLLDERRALVGAKESVVELDLETGGVLEVIRGDGPWRIASSRAGRVLLASEPGRVVLAEGGALVDVASITTGGVSAIGIAASGRRGIAGSFDGSVSYLDLDARNAPILYRSRARPVVGAIIDGTEENVVVLKRDGIIEMNASATAARVLGASIESFAIASLALSASGDRLLASRHDRAGLWDLRSGRCTRVWIRDPRITASALSPDGRSVLLGDTEGGTYRFDASGDGGGTPVPTHASAVSAVAFLPDGRHSVTAGLTGKVHVHGPDGSIDRTIAAESGTTALAVSTDGQRILVGTRDRAVSLWHLPTATLLATIPAEAPPAFVRIAPHDDRLLFATIAGDLGLWRYRDHGVHLEAGRRTSFWTGAARPDFRRFAVADENGLVEYDITRDRFTPVRRIGLGDDTASAIQYSPTGDRLFVGTERGSILELAVGE